MWGAAPRNRRILLLLGVFAVLVFGCVRSAGSAVAQINWAANPSVDFDGDHVTDLGALYRGRSPQDSLWYAPSSSGGSPFQIYFGATTDIPVPGDYDGDGKTDAVIYRPSTGLWYGPRTGAAQIVIQIILGQPGDIPIPGDYNGDGRTDAAIFRPSTGLFFAVFSGDTGTKSAMFGDSDDLPVPADYDGDGKTDFAIYRPNVQGSNGALWHAELSGGGTYNAYWGGQNDIPVPADYNGDRRADPVTWRPSNGLWSGPFNGANGALQYTLGQSGDVPIPGYYDDKDSAVDPTIFRPSTGLWFAASSSSGSETLSSLGVSTDVATQDRPGPSKPPTDKKAPSTPTGLKVVTATANSITATWAASTDNRGVTGYENFRNATKVANGMWLSYTYSGLTCGTTYTIAVDATDAAGNQSGKAQMSATTGACATDTTAPSPVSGLHVTNTTQTSISFAWNAATDNVGVAGYNMFKAGAKVDSTTSLSYTYTGLTCGTQYTFAIQTYDGAGNTSDIAYATAINSTSACGSGDTSAPTTPSGLVIGSATANSITLSWAPSTDDVGVIGYGRYQNGGLISSGTGTSYTFSGLTCGTPYTLGADAYDAAGNRSQKATITASTSACAGDTTPPSTPTNLSASAATTTSITVNWTASTDNVGIAAYTIYNGSNVAGTTSGTSFTVSGLTCGTGYTIGVDATDGAGNRSGKAQVTASTSACSTPPPPPPPSGSGANLWIDPDGGSCTRSDSPAAYSDAAACTWNGAYQAARSGDLVLVRAGNYPVTTIGPTNAALSSAVTIQPDSGATVNVDSLTTNGSWLTLKNFNIPTGSNHARGWFNNASNITLDNVDVTGPWANVKITGGNGVTWKNSGLGNPGNTTKRLCAQGDGEPMELSNVNNLLLSNIDFYPFQPELGNPACGPDSNMHLETIRVWDGVSNWRLERSRFYRGDGSGSARVFFSKISGADPSNVTFANNWFGSSSGTVSIYLTANSPCNNFVFAYNAWEQGFVDQCSPKNSLILVGNTGTEPNYLPCMGTVNTRNLWVWNAAGSCGTDQWILDPGNSLNALKYDSDGYHLQAGSPAINAGESTLCAQYTGGVDIDGRPRSGTCDAGPDEFGN